MVILPEIWTCHTKIKPSCLYMKWNWRTAASIPHRSVGNVSGIWNPKDCTDWPRNKGIQSLSKSLSDCPCFWTIHQHPEDTRSIQADFVSTWIMTSRCSSQAASYNSWQYQCTKGSRTHYCPWKWCTLPSIWIRSPITISILYHTELNIHHLLNGASVPNINSLFTGSKQSSFHSICLGLFPAWLCKFCSLWLSC